MGDLRLERHRTTADLVVARLREAIKSGRFTPGQHLREADLVEELGVSRTPIREALRRLEQERLIVNVPYRGATVKEPSVEEAQQIFQVRAVLEGLAGRLATEHATPETVQQLRQVLKEAAAAIDAGDRSTLTRASGEFHSIIYDATQNQYLSELLEGMRTHVGLLTYQAWSRPERPRQALEEHYRIYQAIAAREPAAAEAAAVYHISIAWVATRAAIMGEQLDLDQ